MEEFALCWNNFQDNIASGFQNLYDRGDLVDVTLACDGKLLRAHKIVLAICSPYFQEMFITNPCKHPIIILKDVTYSVMTELLQFMYQGEVNVKHTELPTFMKIAETLQIKGLTTAHKSNNAQSPSSGTNLSHNKFSSSQSNQGNEGQGMLVSSQSKRGSEMHEGGYSIFPKRQMRQHRAASDVASHEGSEMTTSDSVDNNHNATSMSEDVLMPSISMVESGRFDLINVKRENVDSIHSPPTVRTSITSPSFNFEYGGGPNNGNSGGPSLYKYEYPNELHMNSEHFSKTNNHMDIPAGGNITMLSSTSLLHGNCVFNRNNTVATQQGMKTYWLCKSYRVSMCRARCITHQGRIISATGVHNHPPHIKGSNGPPIIDLPLIQSGPSGSQVIKVQSTNSISSANNSQSTPAVTVTAQNVPLSVVTTVTEQHPNVQHHPSQHPPPVSSQSSTISNNNNSINVGLSGPLQIHHHPPQHQHHQPQHQPPQPPQPHSPGVQNIMQNVLSQNNLMHLTNMSPLLNPTPPGGPQPSNQPPTHLIIGHGPHHTHHHHPQSQQHLMNSHPSHVLHSPSTSGQTQAQQPPSQHQQQPHQPHSHHHQGHHQALSRGGGNTVVLQQQQQSPNVGDQQGPPPPSGVLNASVGPPSEHSASQPTNLMANQMRISP